VNRANAKSSAESHFRTDDPVDQGGGFYVVKCGAVRSSRAYSAELVAVPRFPPWTGRKVKNLCRQSSHRIAGSLRIRQRDEAMPGTCSREIRRKSMLPQIEQ
jgi:hypothetical protein